MIIAKAPLRISFFGGGSDLPQFYSKKPGMVLSAAINRKIAIVVNPCDTNHIRVAYSKLEQVRTTKQLRHERVRHVLEFFNKESNIEIASFSDVTTNGSGLGSSSSFTVALLAAMNKLYGVQLSTYELAEEACMIEIEKCKEPIGKQDQYAAAFGGINCINFDNTGVEVFPVHISHGEMLRLQKNLHLYSTGITRSASEVLKDQVWGLEKNTNVFDNTSIMVEMAKLAKVHLQKGKVDDFGAMLHEAWHLKKKLSSKMTNPKIDEMYAEGIKAGALGGKLLGAGGGGYMLFYAPDKESLRFREPMDAKYKRLDFAFNFEGSKAQRI